MKRSYRVFSLLVLLGLIVAACGAPTAAPAATEPVAAATEAPAATEPAAEATEPAAATEAPAATEAGGETEGKILRIGMHEDIFNLDPAFWPSQTDEQTMDNIAEGLVEYKPGTWEVENRLAESIEQSDDGLSIEFKLKEGVQFQKGYGEVTAEDVKFSYERFLDPELAAPYAGDWETLDNVEVTGTYTGIIHLKEPFAPLWTTTLPLGSGYVLPKAYLEEVGAEEFGRNPVGTGPYEFVEWKPNEHILLKRFDDYWGTKPEWDQIEIIPISEDSAREIALESGSVDFARVAPEAVERFADNPDYEVYPISALDYEWLNINVVNPKLQDINVRQAIRYAVGVQDVIDAAHAGKWERACAMIAPGQVGYWADAPCYERDVEKSKEFLAAAGLDSLDLTISVSNAEADKAAAEVIQAQLAEVGINTEIEVLDAAAFNELGEPWRNRELAVTSFSTNPDPSWSVVWFLCDQVDVWNLTYFCDPELDQLAHDALKEADPAKRAQMYIDIQKKWDEAVPFVWIAYRSYFFVSRADIEPKIQANGRFIAYAFTSK